MGKTMKESWVQVYSGGKFYPFDPKAEDVKIEDIARALSYNCRFNGHTHHFYSVGQHSILCAERLLEEGYSKRIALLGLLHDASEAYFGDIPTPIKRFLPEIKMFEAKIQGAVYAGLHLPQPTSEESAVVHRMDVSMLIVEARTLTDDVEQWSGEYENEESFKIPSSLIQNKAPLDVEVSFLEMFHQLIVEAKEESPKVSVTA